MRNTERRTVFHESNGDNRRAEVKFEKKNEERKREREREKT